MDKSMNGELGDGRSRCFCCSPCCRDDFFEDGCMENTLASLKLCVEELQKEKLIQKAACGEKEISVLKEENNRLGEENKRTADCLIRCVEAGVPAQGEKEDSPSGRGASRYCGIEPTACSLLA